MKITLNTLAYRIIGLYRAMHKNTDHLSIRLVKDWIKSTRALLVEQKLDRSITGVDEAFVQSLGVLAIRPVDTSIFPGIKSDRYILRTVEKIPKTLYVKGSMPAITRIGPIDRLELKYRLTTSEEALQKGFGKFNFREIYAFILDDYIYLTARDQQVAKGIDYIEVRGIFEDPLEAAKVTDPDFDDDSTYPITPSLIEPLEEIIVKTKFPLVVTGLADEQANERDDIVNISKE